MSVLRRYNGTEWELLAVAAAAGPVISAGTNSNATGTINFQTSPSVTFGMDTNGVITASAAGGGAGGGATLNGSTGNVTIVAGGAIGLTNNASTISISSPVQSTQTQGMVSINGSTGDITGVQFSSNAMQTGERNNYIPIGNSTAYQTSVLSNTFLTTAMQSNAGSNFMSTTERANYVQTANSSLFQQVSNTSNITANAVNTSVSTQWSNASILQTNGNAASFLAADGAYHAGGGGGNTITVSGSNGSYQNNAINFVGSNGVNVYTNAGNQVIISGPTVGGAQTGISTVAGGGTTITQGGVTLVGSGNVSITNNAGNIVISGSNQSVQTQGMVSVNGSTGNVTIVAGGAIGLTNNASTISISAPTQTVQTQNSVLINGNSGAFTLAGTSTGSQSTAGSDIAMTHNSNGLNIAVPKFLTTFAAQTVQPAVAQLNGSSGTMSIAFGSNLTGASNASTITLGIDPNYTNVLSATFAKTNAITTAAQSNQVVNSFNGSTGQISLNPAAGLTFTTNASTMTVGIVTNYSTNWTNITSNAFNTSGSSNFVLTANSSLFQATSATSNITSNAFAASATTKFAGSGFTTASTAGSDIAGTVNSNGVSLGIPKWLTAAAGGGNTLTISGSNGSLQTNGLTILGSGVVQVYTTTGNQFVVSAPSGGGAGDGYNPAQFTNSTADSTQNIVWAGNSNGSGNITFGLTGSTVTASYSQTTDPQDIQYFLLQGNTLGTSSISGNNERCTISAGNGIQISGGNNAMTFNIVPDQADIQYFTLGAAGGQALGTLSQSANNETVGIYAGNNITLSGGSNNLTIIGGAGGGGGGATLDRWWNPAIGLNQVTVSGQTNASASIQQMLLPSAIQFSRVDIPMNFSGATTTNNSFACFRFSNALVVYTRTGDTLNPICGVSNTQSWGWSSNATNSIWGSKYLTFNLQTTLPVNEYWVGLHMSSASGLSSIGAAGTTALGASASVFLNSIHTTYHLADMGNTTNVSYNGLMQGLISSAITNTAQTLQVSQISQTGANLGRAVVPMRFRNV